MDLYKNEKHFKVMGLEFAPFLLPIKRRLQTLAVLTCMSTFLFFSLFTILILSYLLFFTSYKWIPLLYAAWVFYDWDTGLLHGRAKELCWHRKSTMWKYFAQYFPIRLIKTCELDPNKTYLFGSHPHGILSFGALGSFGTDALDFRNLFPGIFPRLLVLKQQFYLPGFRELSTATGACAATKQSMENVLSNDKGTAAVLIVGGASEALNHDQKEIKLVLKRRKGFIKLALRFGRDLVPVFTFGENFIYDQAPNPKGSKLRKFQEWVEKVFAITAPAFYGRGVFQYNFGIVPFRKPLNVVVGKPIPVEKIEFPTSEDILSMHEKYTTALKELYDEYNPKYGNPQVKLTIE